MIVYLIQWLKGSKWVPWLTADSKHLPQVLSAISAALLSFGITWTFSQTQPGDTAGVLTITIPMWTTLLKGLWEFLVQFTGQQVIFDGIVQKAGKN